MINEGTWSFPASVKATKELGDLLSKPLLAKDAADKLYSLFGDDELFDVIADAEEENPEADVRGSVRRRLKKFVGKDVRLNMPLPAEVKTALQKLAEGVLGEKVHTLKNPDIKPRGAPEDKARAFDKVNPKTGTRPNRSVLKAIASDHQYYSIEGSNEGDFMQVLVMGGDVPEIDIGRKYHGINVLFMADGSIDKSIADDVARGQWRKDKEKIIAAARKHWKAGTIEAFVKRGGDADLRADDDFDNGYNGYSANPHTHTKKNESKMTFKQFLLTEGSKKIKEPGWYVVDHMDKPVAGPMQERGAKEEADERNKKHAEKHGKGDITPFSAEYYTDYEIRRMNEAKKSDAKRLADQDVEAIMKARADIAKARKSGDKAALEKAKKKLAALTENDL